MMIVRKMMTMFLMIILTSLMNNDGMDDDELGSDFKYIDATRRLRGKIHKGLCVEVLVE